MCFKVMLNFKEKLNLSSIYFCVCLVFINNNINDKVNILSHQSKLLKSNV